MFNPNFYNKFTFQVPPSYVPPPPPPPAFLIPPITPINLELSDQEFIKQINIHTTPLTKKNYHNNVTINDCKEKLRKLLLLLKNITNKKQYLCENKQSLPQNKWAVEIAEVEINKIRIAEILSQINDTYLSDLKTLLTKRSAKRLRLKKMQFERKKAKVQRLKDSKERSRKIDENLQRIKDDINKTKMEDEAKLQADVILKEVLRKKHDAKKSITKLAALIKLRKARQNTAKGKGETVSDKDSATFNNNIEQLKTLWTEKLTIYEKEECDLRAKLKQENEELRQSDEKERDILKNLCQWREFLFGSKTMAPQIDFGGNVGQFIANRSQWDQYLNDEGTSLPVGWVLNS